MTLWRNGDFCKFWAAQTISVGGSGMTQVALPLTAVLILQASPAQMGLLGALEFVPFILVSLFAGVWIDRLPRRPILMGTNIGRALLLGSIPLVITLGVLRIEYLYTIVFLTGVLTVFFDVSYQAFLPSLVKPEQLVEGNSKIQASNSIAQMAGHSLAGGLVELITAPFVILLDAISFLFSTLFLYRIRMVESFPVNRGQRRNIWQGILEGLQLILRNPLLFSITGSTSTDNFFYSMMMSVYLIYLTRDLGINPSIFGLILGITSVGSLVGALLVNRLLRRWGLGATIVGSQIIGGLGFLLIPVANGSPFIIILFLVTASFLTGLTNMTYNIPQVSLRQTIVPIRLQGRLNATVRFIVWGTMPLGSLMGGFLGEIIGLRPTLFVGAIGALLAFLWVFLSPVRTLSTYPAAAVES
ncbi:MAG: MFS transporter [Pseudanabaenales cyanobacterium]|nr:MFS transporter [Pseudanabaenales cyanobacterium]